MSYKIRVSGDGIDPVFRQRKANYRALFITEKITHKPVFDVTAKRYIFVILVESLVCIVRTAKRAVFKVKLTFISCSGSLIIVHSIYIRQLVRA